MEVTGDRPAQGLVTGGAVGRGREHPEVFSNNWKKWSDTQERIRGEREIPSRAFSRPACRGMGLVFVNRVPSFQRMVLSVFTSASDGGLGLLFWGKLSCRLNALLSEP